MSSIRIRQRQCSGTIANFEVKKSPFFKNAANEKSKTMLNSPFLKEDKPIKLRFSDAYSNKIIDYELKGPMFEESLSRNSSTAYSSPQKVRREKNEEYLFTVSSGSFSALCEDVRDNQEMLTTKLSANGGFEIEQLDKKRKPRVSQYHCLKTKTVNIDLDSEEKSKEVRNNVQTSKTALVKIDLHLDQEGISKT